MHSVLVCDVFVFFFKQKTAYEMRISDWSSDVCSSDLYSSNNYLARDLGSRSETSPLMLSGMSTHRLFVALRPPRPARDILRAAMHGISGARWQSDEDRKSVV